MSYSEQALRIGKASNHFESLYGDKRDNSKLTEKELISELLRICNQYEVGFNGFEYLEKSLITNRNNGTRN